MLGSKLIDVVSKVFVGVLEVVLIMKGSMDMSLFVCSCNVLKIILDFDEDFGCRKMFNE